MSVAGSVEVSLDLTGPEAPLEYSMPPYRANAVGLHVYLSYMTDNILDGLLPTLGRKPRKLVMTGEQAAGPQADNGQLSAEVITSGARIAVRSSSQYIRQI